MAKLTDDEIATKLEEVKTIRFCLDKDPLTLGLNSILAKLAEVQSQKSRLSSLIMEAMQNAAVCEIEKEQIQNDHDRKLDLLMATDDDVKNQKSAEQRNTHGRLKMTDQVLALHKADVSSIKAGWYQKILQSVYNDLESANGNLSRQISVIQLESNINGGQFQNKGTIKQINL